MTDPVPLDILFQSSPMTWTEDQMALAYTELRRRWSEFKTAEAAKALAPKAKRGTSTPLTPEVEAILNKPLADLTLEDLMGEDAE